MQLITKVGILADAAKYDASCASSGGEKRDSRGRKGIGSSGGMGICHSYAPDGRCISLLKILLTNFCMYDCAYCVNRSSSTVERARLSVDEVVKLTLDFYRRNYIEGLFLSSGIIQSSDYTMEQLVAVARTLRLDHDFRGYIHLKTIPEASPELLRQAGLYADRLSINVELPSDASLRKLAPEKSPQGIRKSMGHLRARIDDAREQKKNAAKTRSMAGKPARSAAPDRFAPAGQSTQLIVGADASNDARILSLADRLYDHYAMRRVYYSAFSPIPSASQALPLQAPPLMREHRLYQADWLLRFYGFSVNEIADRQHGMLDLDIDPKLAWAIRNRDLFPVQLDRAPLETILRVPGIGTTGARRIVQARRFRKLRFADLARFGLQSDKFAPFVETIDHRPAAGVLESADLRSRFVPMQARQRSLF